MNQQSPSGNRPLGTAAVAARLLSRCARGQWPAISLGLALLLCGTLVGLLIPWPIKLVVDSVLGGRAAPVGLDDLAGRFSAEHPRIALLALLCTAILLIRLLMGLINVVSTYVLVRVGLRMVFRLRCDLFTHLQKLSLRFHDSTTVGDSLFRVTWDSYCVQTMFNSGLIPTIMASATLAGIGAVMFWRDWLLTIVALGVGLPLIMLIKWMDRPMTRHSMRVQERESEISTRVQETFSGIRAVMAFGQEQFESDRFRSKAEMSLLASLKLTLIQTASQSAVGMLLAGGTALVVWITAWRVLQGRLTAGDVFLLVAYVEMLFKPLETLAYTAGLIQGAAAGGRRVFAILDRQPDVADAPDCTPIARSGGAIQLQNVSFAYREDQRVLCDIDLQIAPGQTVALVGPSGAGKTTLVSLLMRFYDPTAGAVTLDGVDLRKLRLADLRRNIALVLQEPVLFAASIAENIAYGRPGATSVQIEAAARLAGAHEFIAALPQGYQTQIGERGVSLSGGQRQRLSIARAFLKDAPILIMDEPTSALDARTEGDLLEALQRLKQGRTTIIIAHRLSTIRSADVIVAMKAGRIVEAGSHEELLSHDGLYAQLHRVQFGVKDTVVPLATTQE